jgi:hypothetical protein
MTRDDFSKEFIRSMRYVIQKHDRADEALRMLRKVGTTPSREQAYANAQTMLDGALLQLADHLYDALEAMKVAEIEP